MKYSVAFEPIPFELKNGVKTQETVIITFFDDKGLQTEIKEYGYLDNHALRDLKMASPSFQLKELYFKDFSIQDNHDIYEWDDNKTVHSFHAEKCFFDGDVNFSGVTFGKGGFSLAHSCFGNGTIDFHKTVFLSDTVQLSGIKFGTGEKIFTSTKFNGKIINFFSTDFGNGDVNFKCSSLINAHLNFSGAIFGDGDVDFDFTTFGVGGVDFSGVNFGKGQISFRNAQFNNGDVMFFGSSFGAGKVTFSDAVFGNGNVDYSFCKFEKCIVHFKYAKLGIGKFNMSNINLIDGYILFKSVRFKSRSIYFSESIIDKLIFLNSLFIEHAEMSLEQCHELVVENCIIEKTFDLIATSKKKVNIDCLNLINTKNLGQIYIDWGTNDVKKAIYSQGISTTYREKADQFRLLKENFHKIGHYDDEDYSYVEYKRCMSMSELNGEDLFNHKYKKIIIINRRIVYPFKWFVLDFVGNYATNPFRILSSMFMTAIIFTILYTLPFIQLNGDKGYAKALNNPLLDLYSNALYHSVATLFTIGYGDVNPGNIYAMILSGLEGFTGLFLMSYFTVAFVRKILR
ncbi:MAG: hypothetical protein CVU84_09750 [Firmicutes bacterium HGW-Firmicutes-1]|jgi:uncharacterized protein YjbI with pentapeptide repeats|nr:MAG: hypothetical protein CVU84_09750 [Firmicutes bacterium HGW-Firmicutes-1]